MRYFLSKACRTVAARLARHRTLCAFDFDGRLSPIVEYPDRACMRPTTRKLLIRLAALYPCTIISGRERRDLLGKLGDVSVTRVIGNHGAETAWASGTARREVEQWKSFLQPALTPLQGVWIEDKGMSLAVHYRQATQKAESRRRIFAAARSLGHARVFGGKQVVNLVVDEAPNKGDAVVCERDRLKCDWVLYVGDDDNDEDAFALDGNVVGVRIGIRRRSHASFYLHDQSEIDELLHLMIQLRTPATAA